MLAALLLLLASASAAPPAEPPDPAAGAKKAAMGPALALPSLGHTRAIVYRLHVEQVRAKPTDAELCALMDDAHMAANTLATPLGKRLDEVVKQPKQLEAFITELTKLEAELPGISLDVTGAGIVAARDYAGLAELAPPAAKAVLLAAVPFALDPPAYLEAKKDKLCMQPDKGTAALEKLMKAWTAAPACVKDKLDTDLERGIRRAGYVFWFCEDATKAKVSAEKFAKALEAATFLAGKLPADQIRKNIAAAEAHFGPTPP